MNGLLAVWNDCDPAVLERYERWYQDEHLPERVGVAGFQNGVRHEAAVENPAKASPRFFTSYDLDDVAVLDSVAYQEMLHKPSLQTQQIMSHFRNMWRFVGKLLVHQGACAGVYSVTIRLGQLQGSAKPRSADLNAWAAILGKAPPARACRWRLYESMLASSQARVAPAAAPSPEARFRSATDSVSHGALLIEHLRRDDLLHTLQTWLTIPDVQRLLHSEDRIDQFLKMSRLDSRAIAAGRATGG